MFYCTSILDPGSEKLFCCPKSKKKYQAWYWGGKSSNMFFHGKLGGNFASFVLDLALAVAAVKKVLYFPAYDPYKIR